MARLELFAVCLTDLLMEREREHQAIFMYKAISYLVTSRSFLLFWCSGRDSF
jgi:hypothetical protein